MHDGRTPAQAARAAMAAVESGRREDWIAGFSEDARVEDPVGHVPPLVGRSALEGFWDTAIAVLTAVSFDVTREWEAGREAMLLATVTITAPGGAATYDGAFNYALDDNGKISTLRAFWDLPAVGAQLAS